MNHLPNSEIKLTRKQKVLKELILLRLMNTPYYLGDTRLAQDHVISGGYRPVFHFRTKEIGGSAADVRIRELRLYSGVPITCKIHKYIDGSGKKRDAWIYRIELTEAQIRAYDWAKCWEKGLWTYDGAMKPAFKEDKHGQIGF